jgi:tight adherence protein C
MLDANLVFWGVTLGVFGSVAVLTVLSGSYLAQRGSVRQRLQPVARTGSAVQGSLAGTPAPAADAFKRKIDTIFANDDLKKSEQRNQLVLAGYFGRDAVLVYNICRLGCVVTIPLLTYFAITHNNHDFSPLVKFAFLSIALLLAYYLPEAYLKRRQRILQAEYRLAFPDLLDLLVVAVDAGLSLESALERINVELTRGHRELSANLAIMSGEMRAGRGTVEALHGLAERLGIDEARSFSVLLQQSIELGTDVADALRVYSDEMREKRLSRAEERAMALPVKIVFPLGAFIFPVILILVLTPVMIKLLAMFSQY